MKKQKILKSLTQITNFERNNEQEKLWKNLRGILRALKVISHNNSDKVLCSKLIFLSHQLVFYVATDSCYGIWHTKDGKIF